MTDSWADYKPEQQSAADPWADYKPAEPQVTAAPAADPWADYGTPEPVRTPGNVEFPTEAPAPTEQLQVPTGEQFGKAATAGAIRDFGKIATTLGPQLLKENLPSILANTGAAIATEGMSIPAQMGGYAVANMLGRGTSNVLEGEAPTKDLLGAGIQGAFGPMVYSPGVGTVRGALTNVGAGMLSRGVTGDTAVDTKLMLADALGPAISKTAVGMTRRAATYGVLTPEQAQARQDDALRFDPKHIDATPQKPIPPVNEATGQGAFPYAPEASFESNSRAGLKAERNVPPASTAQRLRSAFYKPTTFMEQRAAEAQSGDWMDAEAARRMKLYPAERDQRFTTIINDYQDATAGFTPEEKVEAAKLLENRDAIPGADPRVGELAQRLAAINDKMFAADVESGSAKPEWYNPAYLMHIPVERQAGPAARGVSSMASNDSLLMHARDTDVPFKENPDEIFPISAAAFAKRSAAAGVWGAPEGGVPSSLLNLIDQMRVAGKQPQAEALQRYADSYFGPGKGLPASIATKIKEVIAQGMAALGASTHLAGQTVTPLAEYGPENVVRGLIMRHQNPEVADTMRYSGAAQPPYRVRPGEVNESGTVGETQLVPGTPGSWALNKVFKLLRDPLSTGEIPVMRHMVDATVAANGDPNGAVRYYWERHNTTPEAIFDEVQRYGQHPGDVVPGLSTDTVKDVVKAGVSKTMLDPSAGRMNSLANNPIFSLGWQFAKYPLEQGREFRERDITPIVRAIRNRDASLLSLGAQNISGDVAAALGVGAATQMVNQLIHGRAPDPGEAAIDALANRAGFWARVPAALLKSRMSGREPYEVENLGVPPAATIGHDLYQKVAAGHPAEGIMRDVVPFTGAVPPGNMIPGYREAAPYIGRYGYSYLREQRREETGR